MDRRELRKINQLKNQVDPSPEERQQGSLERRDPNTGNYSTNLDDGGSYQARRLFESSVGDRQDVQLNPDTRTADYRSVPPEQESDDAARLDASRAATGIPNPNISDDAGEVSDNENFGNCGVCNGKSITRINCNSGEAIVTFGDETTERIRTPAELEYGARVNFTRTNGSTGSLYVDSCAQVTIEDDKEDLDPGLGDEVYGTLIYQQRANLVNFGGSTLAGLKEFQFYKNECNVTIVGVTPEGQRQVVAIKACDDLEGTYAAVETQQCVVVGDQKACGIDPNSLTYDCVIRGYRLCQKYRISWVLASTGEETFIEDCDPLGYEIEENPEENFYFPGARNVGTGVLSYDSGIPRTFTVNGTISSGEAGYFQIYQSVNDECSYEVVGVTVAGSTGGFSGAVVTKQYTTLFTGGCGFEITLGAYLSDNFLRIYNYLGEIILETGDFIPSSVQGCLYQGMNGTRADIEGSCRASEVQRVEVFEKIVSADNPNGVGVLGIECVSIQ